MVELFPLIPILNPYGSHTVMGGQHWNHRGPISVSHGSHLGPNYVSRKYYFSRIISILSRGSHILECIFIVIKFYQYGTYKGLIWAKKPIWGPESAHMVPIYTCLLGCRSKIAGLGGSVGCAVRLVTRRSRVQPPPRSATFFR